jgi:hypothetical protein
MFFLLSFLQCSYRTLQFQLLQRGSIIYALRFSGLAKRKSKIGLSKSCVYQQSNSQSEKEREFESWIRREKFTRRWSMVLLSDWKFGSIPGLWTQDFSRILQSPAMRLISPRRVRLNVKFNKISSDDEIGATPALELPLLPLFLYSKVTHGRSTRINDCVHLPPCATIFVDLRDHWQSEIFNRSWHCLLSKSQRANLINR